MVAGPGGLTKLAGPPPLIGGPAGDSEFGTKPVGRRPWDPGPTAPGECSIPGVTECCWICMFCSGNWPYCPIIPLLYWLEANGTMVVRVATLS